MEQTYLLRTASVQNVLANRALAEGSNGLSCSSSVLAQVTAPCCKHASTSCTPHSSSDYSLVLQTTLGTCSLVISDLQLVVRWKARISQARERRESGCCCYHAGFLFGLFFDPKDGGDVPQKCRLTFNGLHGVISHTAPFITIAVRWE
jgi:hypothetical protein